jgi:hypothetical protein
MHRRFLTAKRPEPELNRPNSDENLPPTKLSTNCKMHQTQVHHCNRYSKAHFGLNSDTHINLKSNSHLTENAKIFHYKEQTVDGLKKLFIPRIITKHTNTLREVQSF